MTHIMLMCSNLHTVPMAGLRMNTAAIHLVYGDSLPLLLTT
jgi:hypothetical protein